MFFVFATICLLSGINAFTMSEPDFRSPDFIRDSAKSKSCCTAKSAAWAFEVFIDVLNESRFADIFSLSAFIFSSGILILLSNPTDCSIPATRSLSVPGSEIAIKYFLTSS